MKKILYIRADGIYNDSRATKEIRSILKAGYVVCVLGWDRTGDSMQKCEELFISEKGKIQFCFYNRSKRGSFVDNICSTLGWLKFVKSKIKEKEKDIWLVHACDLDTILLSYKYIISKQIKLIYDVYDYYVDSHSYFPSLFLKILEYYEIDILNKADAVIICTEERKRQIAKSKPRKVEIIHNTPDIDFLRNEIIYDYFYCGALGPNRLLEETFNAYPQNKDIRVGIGGSGTYGKKANDLGTSYSNFEYHGSIMYDKCLELESKSLCLSAIYEPTLKNHKLCAPNKFYEALALGKPIIVCRGTGIDKIVEDNNLGCVIDYDVNQFYDALRSFIANPEKCYQIGERARCLYETKYCWKIMEERLIELYKYLRC